MDKDEQMVFIYPKRLAGDDAVHLRIIYWVMNKCELGCRLLREITDNIAHHSRHF